MPTFKLEATLDGQEDLALTGSIFPEGSDVAVVTAIAFTQSITRHGTYYVTLTATLDGVYMIIFYEGLDIRGSGYIRVCKDSQIVIVTSDPSYDSDICTEDTSPTSSSTNSDSLLGDSTIAELVSTPRKVMTDEGSVEERSVDELIKADEYLINKGLSSGPFHGLRISRFKPGGAV